METLSNLLGCLLLWLLTENCLLSLRISSDYLSVCGRDNYGNPRRHAPRQPQCNKQNVINRILFCQIFVVFFGFTKHLLKNSQL